MGHRALIARERPDGRYDLHVAGWGGADLADGRRRARSHARGGDAVARGIDRGAVPEHVDWLAHEAVYVVPVADVVEAYLAVPLRVEPGTPGEATASGPGLLVAPPADDPTGERLRARVAGARAAVRDLVERGAVSGATAAAALAAVARSWGGRTFDP